MSKTFKISLTKQGINDAIKELEEYQKTMKLASERIQRDLINIGADEISKNISNDAYSSDSKLNVVKRLKKPKSVGMSGDQAIYDEFGTGTLGKNNPHEDKDGLIAKDFTMNEYDSGATIRENIGFTSKGKITGATRNGIPLNARYWTYKDKSGKIIYTQGRPAGMQVYHASKVIRQQLNEVIKKRLEEIK